MAYSFAWNSPVGAIENNLINKVTHAEIDRRTINKQKPSAVYISDEDLMILRPIEYVRRVDFGFGRPMPVGELLGIPIFSIAGLGAGVVLFKFDD